MCVKVIYKFWGVAGDGGRKPESGAKRDVMDTTGATTVMRVPLSLNSPGGQLPFGPARDTVFVLLLKYALHGRAGLVPPPHPVPRRQAQRRGVPSPHLSHPTLRRQAQRRGAPFPRPSHPTLRS